MSVLVLIDKMDKVLIPINEGFFTIAQFLNEKKLNIKYAGSLVLFPSGDVKEIAKIRVNSYYGNTIWSKLFSMLNTTYNTSVELKDCQVDASTCEMIVSFLSKDQGSVDPYMPKQNLGALENITSARQLYSALILPAMEDCLDVMV